MLDVLQRPVRVAAITDMLYPQHVISNFFGSLAKVKQNEEYWHKAFVRNDPLRVLLSATEEEALRLDATMAKVFAFLDKYEADNYPRSAPMYQALSIYVDLYPY